MRLPGIELLGIAPNWLLIWVVVWVSSAQLFKERSQDWLWAASRCMTSPHPTHALSLAFSGNFDCSIAEAALHPGRLVFGMAVLAETVTALQFSFLRSPGGAEARAVELAEIWTYHQQIALCSAILSSLWAPVVYYPSIAGGSK